MADKRKSPSKENEGRTPGGAAVLYKSGLVSYDIARLIDDAVFEQGPDYSEYPGYSTRIWRSGNKIHREFDQPAIISNTGRKAWYRRGQLHRNYQKGPAQINPQYGITQYYHRGKLHNPEGPAVIRDKFVEYYIHGQRHRIDGPAVEYVNPTEMSPNEYWENGKLIRKEFPPPPPSSSTPSSPPGPSEPPTKKRKKE